MPIVEQRGELFAALCRTRCGLRTGRQPKVAILCRFTHRANQSREKGKSAPPAATRLRVVLDRPQGVLESLVLSGEGPVRALDELAASAQRPTKMAFRLLQRLNGD
jgi:hypothetical protein